MDLNVLGCQSHQLQRCLPVNACGHEGSSHLSPVLALRIFIAMPLVSLLGKLGAVVLLRKASVARVNRRLRRYYLIVRLLSNVFVLACLSLGSI